MVRDMSPPSYYVPFAYGSQILANGHQNHGNSWLIHLFLVTMMVVHPQPTFQLLFTFRLYSGGAHAENRLVRAGVAESSLGVAGKVGDASLIWIHWGLRMTTRCFGKGECMGRLRLQLDESSTRNLIGTPNMEWCRDFSFRQWSLV
jgi:hypothetical protein